MRILIEGYPYRYQDVKDLVPLDNVWGDVEKSVYMPYVGYYYNPTLGDCVFILPKVLLDKDNKVFGKYEPQDIINFKENVTFWDSEKSKARDEERLLYTLSVWIYRAIVVYKNGTGNDTSIVYEEQVAQVGKGKRKQSDTFLDILLALIQFNKENQHFFMFILKNLHSGFNKINWGRTIAKSTAIIQRRNGKQNVLYMNPVNKKRSINFDEELLIIYFSILQHLHDNYGFPVNINVNFPLIKGKQFQRYLEKFGVRRLQQIKYKYFSDKALQLWELCYAFFDQTRQIYVNTNKRDFLLVKNFNIVFEAIIDELIAGDQQLPKELLDQSDGKRVDHMYQYQELTNNEKDDTIYYIGDSKYYKQGNSLGKESVYKQFTYARNVIQWNIDLFNDGKPEEQKGHIKLRDDETEGYNVIPNFFISAQQTDLKAVDDIQLTKGRQQYYLSRQFENRLFDRDTFLLAHYDVNFLFVVALYGRNNQASKGAWRTKVRKLFRTQTQQMLKENFEFYAMTAHADIAPERYIKEHFQMVLGKVYHPFDGREGSDQQYYSLALRKPEHVNDAALKQRLQEENEQVLFELQDAFYVAKCELGTDPRTLPEVDMPIVEPRSHDDVPEDFLTMHYLEKYPNDSILIGGYNGWKQLNWIFGREGGKRDDAYNVRLGGKDVHGAVVKSRDYVKHAKFVILYDFEHQIKRLYTFRVKNTGEMSKEKMIETGYENPRHDRYFCYFFDEEITLGKFDIDGIIEAEKRKPGYVEGMPIYMTGSELIKFRK